MTELAALVAANEDAAAAIAASYEMLLGGVPNIAGFTFLIDNAIATNYGSNDSSIVFNQENIFINVANALVQGNPDAAAGFAAIVSGAASLADKVAAIYNAVVPPSVQSEGGLEYVTRPEALAFYAQVAAERGVEGANGAAIVALASILNIAYENDLLGVGDSVNDLLAAIADGSAVLPDSGDTFTPIEVADGPNYDSDDFIPGQVTLSNGTDIESGTIFDAPLVYTPGGNDRINSLQDEDELTGTGTDNVLNATLGNANDNGATTVTPGLTNIQTVNVAFTGSGLAAVNELDLQDATGITKAINITRISDGVLNGVTIDNISTVPLDLSITNSGQEQQGVSFFFTDAAVKGAGDETTLTLSNVQLGYIDIEEGTNGVLDNGIETINLVSKGSENKVGTIYAEDLQTLNITGDQDLRLGVEETVRNLQTTGIIEAIHYGAALSNVAGSLTKVDASGLSGNLEYVIANELNAGLDGTSGTPVQLEVLGGSGDDVFRIHTGSKIDGAANNTDKIDGGDGDDTLVLLGNNVIVESKAGANLTSIEALEIRTGHDTGNGGDTVTVDADAFDALATIYVRNEGQNNTGPNGTWQPALKGEQANVVLNDLTVAQATAVTIAHSTSGSNGLGTNLLSMNLKDASGKADSAAINIVDGVNLDPRFNFILSVDGNNDKGVAGAGAVENLTINDNDTESNTVLLTNIAEHSGTITITGENAAGTFLNLDATANALRKDASGSDADLQGIVDPAGGAAERFSGATVDASAYTGDLIVRVSNNAALPNGAQTILGGSGDDHIIFDALNDTTAGLTISDKVNGGDGFDTLYIDGFNKLINIGKSEWTNVSNIEAIHLVGQSLAGTNLATVPGKNDAYGKNSYNLTLTNDLIAANGEAVTGGRVIHIINDNDPLNGYDPVSNIATADDVTTALNRGVTIDARELNAQSSFTYDGEEGQFLTNDRFIMADANVNGLAVIDGGAVLVAGFNTPTNTANADVFEVRNAAVVTIGDLVGVSNVGTIEFTNDQAAVQAVYLELDNATVDRMVNTSQAASATGVETLTVAAYDNPLVVGANTVLTLDGSQITNQFLNLNVTGGGGDDVITAGAGDDIINGGAGNDIIDGGAGNDQLFGGTGNDTINGGAGNDLINAGPGNNVVTGGAGADTFQFNNGDSVQAFLTSFTIITDFNSSEDKIDVTVAVAGFGSANGAAAANLAAANALVNFAAAEAFLVFNYNNTGDSFLYIDTNNDGAYQVATDGFIQLTGVTSAAGFDISDFV